MLTILIPPAKEMLENIETIPSHTQFSPLTSDIIKTMSEKSIEELMTIYRFKKEAPAQKEFFRWSAINKATSTYHPAIKLYNGLMYRSLKNGISQSAMEYLKKTTHITTALYGIIPINYPIQAHRLDFLDNVAINKQALKKLWNQQYDAFVSQQGATPIISLLSNEFETVFSKQQRIKFVKIQFYEKDVKGNLKQHSTISKKGRGAFLKALAENNVEHLEQLPNLSFNNYHYSSSLSNSHTYVFIHHSR